MAKANFTEAPLKRKLSDSEAADCKKPWDCPPGNVSTGNCAEGDCSAQSSGQGASNATEDYENLLKGSDKNLVRNGDLIKSSTDASGPDSGGLEDTETLGEGEVLEAASEQDDNDDDERQGDEEEVSEIDTENDSVDEEEEEDADSDDEDEDDSDNEEDDEDETLMSSSRSLHAIKSKGVEEGKGKEKMVDVEAKGIMPADKGKGKAIAEDKDVCVSEDDDAGYLSEDPFDEVDLNNILPTRTRRRNSTTNYEFVEQGDGEDDEDDSDA